ncbi:MAG: type II toxin-antitoxin system HicB family antitoxin [Deltaproteobacteria bacterium]|nr:type II toxin-antitoxin system HicB family antitoxin [Deltaproteobacteria bacterium]
MKVFFNVIITNEPPWYVARCIDNNIASQGHTIEEALASLKEALELYFEDTREIPSFMPPSLLTRLEITLP